MKVISQITIIINYISPVSKNLKIMKFLHAYNVCIYGYLIRLPLHFSKQHLSACIQIIFYANVTTTTWHLRTTCHCRNSFHFNAFVCYILVFIWLYICCINLAFQFKNKHGNHFFLALEQIESKYNVAAKLQAHYICTVSRVVLWSITNIQYLNRITTQCLIF